MRGGGEEESLLLEKYFSASIVQRISFLVGERFINEQKEVPVVYFVGFIAYLCPLSG
jgi:hypothetical protein